MRPYYSAPDGQLFLGDAIEVLRGLPSESVQCVVTSPPYFGLRDYQTAQWEGGESGCQHGARLMGNANKGAVREVLDGESKERCYRCGARRIDAQLGLEPTPDAYIARMVEVFREVRRVLRSDGVLWLNIGDSYAANRSYQVTDNKHMDVGNNHGSQVPNGLKPKDLVGIPWMLALALRADGWWLRSDIIWHKPNPMPESVTDRPTKSHEYVFLLSKSERYYYDAEAVREGFADERMGNPGAYKWAYANDPITGQGIRGNGGPSTKLQEQGWNADGCRSGRNLRSVWTIATEAYPGSHFATYPTALVEPCVKAGTSERGCCPKCGAPWRRLVEREYRSKIITTGSEAGRYELGRGRNVTRMGDGVDVTTTGWQPSCTHAMPPQPCVVLDPFAGSGTTAAVARGLGRRWIGCDLNASYLDLAIKRIEAVSLPLPLGL